MSAKNTPSKRIDRGLIKRIAVIALGNILVIAVVQAVLYMQRPQITYSLKRADCTKKAIAARNRAAGADLDSCVLVVAATNLKNKSQYVDYEGVGGGPAGGGGAKIRIYTAAGRFCYAGLAEDGASFAPRATNQLILRCKEVLHPPKNYDTASDADPAFIEISDGHSTVRLDVKRYAN